MAFSVSALNLVNRVHRRRRMPDVGSISETEDLATLDTINHAIEDVLSTKRWEFDMRRAQITLRGRLTDLVATNSVGVTSSFGLTRSSGLEQADTVGDYVARLLVTGSTDYANTALRINYSGAILGGVYASVSTSTDFPELVTNATAELFYAEYILPDTVREIIRMTFHEEQLTLEQIDPVVEFDELYPRPQIEFGRPRVVSVGGYDVATYLSSGDPDPPSLRMIVWPVPDEDYLLEYTYHVRHPELAAADDVLEGVPPGVVDLIVEKAANAMKATYEKDYEALRLEAYTNAKMERMHTQQGGMYADRKPAGNWDGRAGVFRGDQSWVRGRTIGGG